MKSQHVQDWIKEVISSGTVKKGQKLPSCREIAKLLGVNKITVNHAFHALEEELLVYGIPKGGYYVAESPIEKAIPTWYDFKTVSTDRSIVPHRELAHVFQKAMAHHKAALYQYESPAGLLSLRKALNVAFENEGIYAQPDRMVVTNGAQQALYLLLQSLFTMGKRACTSLNPTCADKLLVESPTYNLVLQMADQLGIEVVSISRTDAGYDLKALENIMMDPTVKAFYLMPRHHNPTGFSLSEKQKQAVSRLAIQHQVLLIEDDYLADLGTKKGSMPLFYYDTADTTVYIRSFSKAFMPGIRLGVAILPQTCLEPFIQIKHLTDLNTSKLPQSALELFLHSGMYQRHLKKVRRCYDEKLRRAADILTAQNTPYIQWHVPAHGIFIWGELNPRLDAAQLVHALELQNILVGTGSGSFIEKSPPSIRLCVAGIEIHAMKAGLSLLLKVLETEAGKF